MFFIGNTNAFAVFTVSQTEEDFPGKPSQNILRPFTVLTYVFFITTAFIYLFIYLIL